MKKKLIIAGILLVLAGLIYGGIQWKKVQNEKREERVLLIEYCKQNRAFGMSAKVEYSGYQGYEEVDEKWLYIALAAYNDWNCENSMERLEVTLDDIKEYLSGEFNKDGSLRVYSKPQGIQDYVIWYSEGGGDVIEEYWAELSLVVQEYLLETPNATPKKLTDRTIEQLQELINKYNDPDYEINADIMGETE